MLRKKDTEKVTFKSNPKGSKNQLKNMGSLCPTEDQGEGGKQGWSEASSFGDSVTAVTS